MQVFFIKYCDVKNGVLGQRGSLMVENMFSCSRGLSLGFSIQLGVMFIYRFGFRRFDIIFVVIFVYVYKFFILCIYNLK